MRLVKFLAHAGVASRRRAEEIIAEGRVAIDGEAVTDPARPVGEGARVTVDGQRVALDEEHVVYLVNKPAGVVSTAQDTHGRPTVVGLVNSRHRLYPVGRLDADTTGLIILTNDGALAYALMHPSFEVPRTYRAVVRPALKERAIWELREGVQLDDGPTAPAQVRRLAHDTLEITIHEGRKRQVRRMCEAVGHRVVALERVSFGPLRLGDLEPGKVRRLSDAEIARLHRAARGPRRRIQESGAPGAPAAPGGRSSGRPEPGRPPSAAPRRPQRPDAAAPRGQRPGAGSPPPARGKRSAGGGAAPGRRGRA